MPLRTNIGKKMLICFCFTYFIVFTVFHFINNESGRMIEIGFNLFSELVTVVMICYALKRFSSPQRTQLYAIGILFLVSRFLLVLGDSYEIFNWIPLENSMISRTCYLVGKVLFLIILLFIVTMNHQSRRRARLNQLVMFIEIAAYACIAATYLSLLWLEPQNMFIKGMRSAFYVIFDINALFFAIYASSLFRDILHKNERVLFVLARVVFLISSIIFMVYLLVLKTKYYSSLVYSYLSMAETIASLVITMIIISFIMNHEHMSKTKLSNSSIYQSIRKNIVPLFWVYPTLCFTLNLKFEPLTKWFIVLGGILLLTRQILASLEDYGFLNRFFQLHDSFDGEVEWRTQQLLVSEQRYKSLFEQMEESFIILNRDLHVLNHNPAFELFMRENFSDQHQLDGIHWIIQQDVDQWDIHIREVLRNHKVSFSSEVHNDQHSLLHLDITVFPYVLDEEILGVLILIKDQTQFYENQLHIHNLAFYDQLTQLLNRYAFFQQVEPLLAAQQPAMLLFIDMDNLKEINDRHGHEFGDAMLKEVSQRSRGIVQNEGIICRFSGDEFLIFLQDYDIDQAEHLAKQLIESFQETFSYNDVHFSFSCSIGIAQFPQNGSTLDELIIHADMAMYQVKKGSGNHYLFFNETISKELNRKSLVRNELKYAIAKRQLQLYYQPQYDILDNEFVGMEALIRWKHPELGFIPPMEFITIAEEDGTINRIGDWVIEEACAQLRAWSETGISKPVAINVSLKQLEQANFVQKVEDIANKYDIDRALLKLEITESIAMSSTKYAVEALSELKSRGFSISMDDFGTGYSSMSYLMSYPIDALKIDRAFIGDITSTNKVKLVDIIVNMAHQLDLHVVAEGVETKEQLEYLRNLDCRYIQGYYISKPLPADEITALLSSNTDPFLALVK